MFYNTSERTSAIAERIFKGWGMDSIHSVDGCVTYGSDRGIDFPLFSPQSTTYGDYCGAAYTRSNHEALCEIMDEIEEERGIDIYYVARESYGTHSLQLYPRALSFSEVREALQAIADYPSLDDERASEIEQEGIDEAWESYARSDFRTALERIVPEGFWHTEKPTGGESKSLAELDSLNPLDYPGAVLPWDAPETIGPDADEVIGLLTDEQVDALWYSACDAISRYPQEESYGSFHFDVDAAAESLDWEDEIVPELPRTPPIEGV